jgi:hypothetical protein
MIIIKSIHQREHINQNDSNSGLTNSGVAVSNSGFANFYQLFTCLFLLRAIGISLLCGLSL